MTWKELQEHIEILDDDQKKCHIVLYDAVRSLYYMGTEMVKDEEISKDPCLNISQL